MVESTPSMVSRLLHMPGRSLLGLRNAYRRSPASPRFMARRLWYRAHARLPPEDRPLVDAFGRDGFVVLPGLLAPERLGVMRKTYLEHLERLDVNPPIDKHSRRGLSDVENNRTLDLGKFQTLADLEAFGVDRISGKDPLTWDAAFLRFALDERILGIVAAHFGFRPVLGACMALRTPVSRLQATDSSAWHRDSDATFLGKAFLYLNDVDRETARFAYATGTHRERHAQWDGKHRLSDDAFAEHVGRERWVDFTGPAGTVILADTRGFHKGVPATKRHRDIFWATYTEGPAWSRRIDPKFVHGLSASQRAALGSGPLDGMRTLDGREYH